MDERITKLETLAALQDRTIQGLNEEVYRQEQDIAKLCQRIEFLEKKIELMEQPEEISGNERPPHY